MTTIYRCDRCGLDFKTDVLLPLGWQKTEVATDIGHIGIGASITRLVKIGDYCEKCQKEINEILAFKQTQETTQR